MNKNLIYVISLVIVIFCLLIFFQKEILIKGLYFVDAGRFALVARSFLENGKFYSLFNFYNLAPSTLDGWVSLLPPVHILAIAIFMKLFGVGDFAVMLESFVFFILTLILTYLLAKNIFSRTVAFFSTIFLALNMQLLGYAKDGASEPIFICLIVAVVYFINLQKKWCSFISGLLILLLIFTKLQSYVIAPFLVIWFFLLNKKVLDFLILVSIPVLGVLLNVFGVVFGYYHIWIPSYLLLQQSSVYPGDNITRFDYHSLGNQLIFGNIRTIFTKFLYNLYNFYKVFFQFDPLLPSLITPFISLTYLFSNIFLFNKVFDKIFLFRIFTFFIILFLVILSSLTSPSVRYIQIVIPFIVILAVDFIVRFLSSVFTKDKFMIDLVLLICFIIFFVNPFLGKYFIDSRFESKIYNLNKPYAGKLLGEKLGVITASDSKIVTNLHTWGSWYGRRITMLIPIDLISFEDADKIIHFDYIYLTDYQKDNPDRPIQGDWQKLFTNSNLQSSSYITNQFSFVEEGSVYAKEDYENQRFTYKIWKRKVNSENRISKN